MEWCPQNKYFSFFYKFLGLVCLLTILPTVSFATRGESKKTQSSFWIVGRTHPEHTEFTAKKVKIRTSVYMPNSSLVLGKASVENWAQRLSHPFQVSSGNDVVFHFRTHYEDRWSTIWPGYAMQMNLEIPAHLLKNQTKIKLEDLRGYLTWSQPDYTNTTSYLTPKEGHFEVWRVKNGYVKGWLNLKFYDHNNKDELIHIYGKVRSRFKSRHAYQTEQDGMRQRLYRKANRLEHKF